MAVTRRVHIFETYPDRPGGNGTPYEDRGMKKALNARLTPAERIVGVSTLPNGKMYVITESFGLGPMERSK